MKPAPIRAFTAASTKDDFCVLYIPYGIGQLNIVTQMAIQSSFDSYVYFDTDDLEVISAEFPKLHFIRYALDVETILERFSRIVTSFSFRHRSLPPEIHGLIERAQDLRIPIVDVPHGLFQPGRNMVDTTRIIDIASSSNGIGDIIPSFADTHVCWNGADGIGYPRYMPDSTRRRDLVIPKYNVIITNTNWYLYSSEDRRQLFRTIIEHIEARGDELFIWHPHPAETNDERYASIIITRRPRNCLLYGMHRDIYFDGIHSTEDLIAYSSYGITTLSTCILDFEINNIPVHVFDCDGTSDLVRGMDDIVTFRKVSDLQNPPRPPKTGLLKQYDPQLFDEILRSAASRSRNTAR